MEDRGGALVAELRDRLARIAARTRRIGDRARVACIEWFEPLMAAGNWMPELVEIAGGRNLFASAGAHSPWLSWEALEDAQPDCILLMPCGFDIPRSRSELPALTRQPAWSRLQAVQEGRVFLTDGNQFFNRPGRAWWNRRRFSPRSCIPGISRTPTSIGDGSGGKGVPDDREADTETGPRATSASAGAGPASMTCSTMCRRA